MPLRLDTEFRELKPASRWVNGEPPPAAGLKGKPTVVHFWAMSCPACHLQLEHVVEWEERFGDRIHLISVHTPMSVSDMNEDKVEEMVRAHGLRHPVAIDSEDGALADIYDVRVLPSYFVFDAEGRLRHYHSGLEAILPVERAIERVLGQTSEAEAQPEHA